MKLTDKQMELLRAIVAGKRCSFHPYMGRFNPRAYYSCATIGACTPSAKALLTRKLVAKAEQERYSESHVLIATQEGINAARMPTQEEK